MLKWLMLTLYILLIIYVLARTFHCIKWIIPFNHKLFFIPFSILFIVLCATLLLGGLLPHGDLRISLHKFSNYWLGLFIYFVFFVLSADIFVLILKLINKKYTISLLQQTKGYAIIGSIVAVLTVVFTIYGLIHANRIYIHDYECTIDKNGGANQELNVILLADLHLGYSIGIKDMQQMVEKVNALHPDIILIAGDIVDNEYEAMADPDAIAEILSSMQSRYGTYAVYGNHDVAETLIGGFSITPASQAFRDPRVAEFMKKANFHMLEDESVLIDDSFYVVGRLDGEKAGDGTRNRKTTEELVENLDLNKPVILLSHEPDELQENADAGIDLLLNGHTHAGQFFPLTICQPWVWKNYWGYLQVDQMHDYVTSGIGIYGPDMRTATDSEIMQIKVHFK